MPNSPTVEPSGPHPGDEIDIISSGLNTTSSCDPELTKQASYWIRVQSSQTGEVVKFESVSPTEDGGIDTRVRIPNDFPLGDAVVDIMVDGPRLFCEVDQTLECGHSAAVITLVGPN